MEEKTTGLLLQAIPYLEGQRILKVLTAEHGLISLIAYRKTSSVLTSPFVWAEWVYKVSSRPLYSLKDGTLLDDLRDLKENFARLSAAGLIATDLLKTQLPGKSATEPLVLALACLRKLSIFKDPTLLAAAFRLRLLMIEGVLNDEDLSTPYLKTLGLSRSFQEISTLTLSKTDIERINNLFDERL